MGLIFKGLTFGGVSSLTYGIYITGEAVWNAPERSVTMVTIPGRNGTLALDNGRFENIEVTYPAGCFADNMADFKTKIESFRNAIFKTSYQRLTDDYNTDEFRLGVYKTAFDVEPGVLHHAGEFTLAFDCKPQRFLTSGESAQTFTTNGTITNPTQFASSPLIVVTGYGQLGIGAYTITIQGDDPTQKIYIDTDTMEAWGYESLVIVSKNDYIAYLNNTIPKLISGSNSISLDTYISKVEITPRWWRI